MLKSLATIKELNKRNETSSCADFNDVINSSLLLPIFSGLKMKPTKKRSGSTLTRQQTSVYSMSLFISFEQE